MVGDFKSSVYQLAKEFLSFFEANNLFTPKQILRMSEAEFISELLLAMEEGIRAGSRAVIDKCYKDYDDDFPHRKRHEKRFRKTMDTIGGILGQDLPQLEFSATRLFYPLFCAIFHLKFRLPKLNVPRCSFGVSAYPKMKTALEQIDALIDGIENEKAGLKPSAEEQKFYAAYDEHWVHAEERTILTQYICKQLVTAIRS